MSKFLVRWIIIALALFLAAALLPGIEVEGTAWVAYAVMAFVLALMNALVRPVLKVLTCPLILLTLGLFALVINAIVFMLASWLSNVIARGLDLAVAFNVRGFGWALLGSLIVSIVTVVLSALVKDQGD